MFKVNKLILLVTALSFGGFSQASPHHFYHNNIMGDDHQLLENQFNYAIKNDHKHTYLGAIPYDPIAKFRDHNPLSKMLLENERKGAKNKNCLIPGDRWCVDTCITPSDPGCINKWTKDFGSDTSRDRSYFERSRRAEERKRNK